MLQTDTQAETMVEPSRAGNIVPRAPREQPRCAVDIFGPTINRFNSMIRNISTSGMLIDHQGQLSVGDFIVAKLPGLGEVMGEVVRLKDGGAGMKFTAPINLPAFRRAVTSAGSGVAKAA